jgi:hypothetical protein
MILNGCNEAPLATEEGYTITYGTSFGMCTGDCYKETSITEDEAVLTVASYGNPPNNGSEVRASKELSTQEFERIKDMVEMSAFIILPDRIGCPDCTDGGAEFIEISTVDFQKKVTFEYLDEPSRISDLVVELREFQEELYTSSQEVPAIN